MHLSRRWSLTFLTALAATTAGAQRIAAVPLGARMRIVTCTGTTITGKYGGISGDSIALAVDSMEAAPVGYAPERVTVARSVATSCVQTWSVFEKYGSAAGRGALVGGGLGLALISLAYAGDLANERRGGDTIIPATAFAVPVALVLTGIGAWLGAISGPEQWSVPTGMSASMRVVPGGGVTGLSVRF